MRKLVCFVRGLLGEETRAFTFHRGPLLFILSLKAERTRQGCQCTAPAPLRRFRTAPAPQRSAQPALRRPPLLGPARTSPGSWFSSVISWIPCDTALCFPVLGLLPPSSPEGTGQLQREGAAGATPFVSRGQPAHTPGPGRLPAAPDTPAARSRATREELPGTPGTHAARPAAAELQVPKSLARRARGCMSQ